MADKLSKVLITFAGGLATDFGPSFTGAPHCQALQLAFFL